MANLFVKTGSNFSTATYQKVVAAQLNPSPSAYSGRTSPGTAPVYIAFTPSESGTIEGAYVLCSNLNTNSAAQSYTVNLQQYSGGAWADVAGVTKTLTYAQVAGTDATIMTGVAWAWTYFEFGTTTAITTDASTWRLKVTATSTAAYLINNAVSGFNYAIVITGTTAFTPGDSVCLNNGITMTVDQTQTFGTLIWGVDTIVTWANPPAASYTLTATLGIMSGSSKFIYGTSTDPIAAAVRGTIAVTTWYLGMSYFGSDNNTLNLYGARPTNYRTSLAADANATQKVIVTTDNMQAYWNPGDTVMVWGGQANSSTAIEQKIIDTVVGTTVTFTTNLAYKHADGWFAVNTTRFGAMAGCVLGASIVPSVSYGQWFLDYKISGVNAGSYSLVGVSGYTSLAGEPTSKIKPILMQDVMSAGGYISNIIYTGYSSYWGGSSFSNIYLWGRESSSSFYAGFGGTSGVTTVEYVTGGTYVTNINLQGDRFVVSNCQGQNRFNTQSGFSSIYIIGNNNTVTNCKTYGGYSGYYANNVSCTYTGCTADGAVVAIEQMATAVSDSYINCVFGQEVANTNTIAMHVGYLQQPLFTNCVVNDTNPVKNDTIATNLAGSSVRFQTFNQTTNDHRTWQLYGKTQSTGTSLVDTTVHTAGGFAIRFLPNSSTSNQTWTFDIPTGNIQTKTMMVGVWCKINSATYYANTHQLPRITVDYDNGTTAYTQATESTDWQFLPLPFTPTTTYGQITVTLSARTDATTTDAYVYWDDFATLYPADAPLNAQTFDLWANALPVTPPIATVLSANDVWAVETSSLTGAGTVGRLVTKLLTVAKFLGLK